LRWLKLSRWRGLTRKPYRGIALALNDLLALDQEGEIHSETRRHLLRRSGSSSRPLSCDFPDQPRDEVALGLLGAFTG